MSAAKDFEIKCLNARITNLVKEKAEAVAGRDELRAIVEQAYREGYAAGFSEGGGGYNGYVSPPTNPDPDSAWEFSEAAEAARKVE